MAIRLCNNKNMKIGYARISNGDRQDTALQTKALKEAGVDKIFEEKASGSFAEFERAMIRERTKAGLERARGEGRVGGRRPKLTSSQREEIVDMVLSGRKSASEASRLFGVHPSTVCRILAGHVATE